MAISWPREGDWFIVVMKVIVEMKVIEGKGEFTITCCHNFYMKVIAVDQELTKDVKPILRQ